MSQEQTQRPHLVTKAELIKDVLRITREEDARDLHAVDVEVVLDALAEACAARLAAGDDVTLPGIGRPHGTQPAYRRAYVPSTQAWCDVQCREKTAREDRVTWVWTASRGYW